MEEERDLGMKNMKKLYETIWLHQKELYKNNRPCLVCLSGLSASLRTKGSLVRFPVRAHA